MKTPLSLCLMVAATSALAACSSDEGADRNAAPSSPTAGTTGSPAAGTGGTTAVGVGGAGGAGGAGPGAGSELNLGAPLTITEDGNVIDEANSTDIAGGAAFAQSSVMTEPALATYREGGLCFSGTTATVPDTSSYGTHWGAELTLDLNRVANPDAPPTDVDAGADAGPVLGTVAADWPVGSVIGFAYTLVGQNPDGSGVPPANFRFKALPAGGNPENDTYCSNRTPVSGTQETVLFSDITFECWAMGNYSLAEDPIQFLESPDPNRVVGTRENPRALRNIAWQISSDINIDPIPFNFCVTDLRPILAAE